MSSRQRFLLLLLAGGTILGCSSSLSDGGGTPIPSNSQFSELTRSFEDELESGVPNLGVLLPGLPPSYPAPANCPTVSNTNDADGDHITDDATFSYTNPPCLASSGIGTLAVTGTVRLQDLSQANATAYRLTFSDLTWQFTDPAATLSYTSVRNGVRNRSDSAGITLLVVNDTTKRQRPQITAIATIAKSLTWRFTPASGTVVVDQPLPSGTLSVDGTWHWTRSTEDWNLAVATLTPLQYDASCTTTAQRIKAGKVTLTGTIAGTNGTLLLTWTACGTDPSRSFTAAP